MKKFINGIGAAFIAVSMLAVSAAAVDYGTDPDYEPPADSHNGVITADAVKDAIERGDYIIIGEGALLSVAALAEIAKGGEPVVFVGNGFTITIYPGDIGDNAKAIDISAQIVAETKKIEGRDVRGVYIYPAHSGDFGFTLTLTVLSAYHELAENDMSNVRAYYINDDGKVESELDVVVSGGATSIRIDHASSYVLTEEALLSDKDKKANTGVLAGDSKNPGTGVVAALGSAAVFAGLTAVLSSKKKAKK
ncbi:MAG: hypothetical protein LBI38_00155 [Oscillospiraceae bacterium]|jgi:hypothetical protein|nr:hypothetical protein [Oscillospiraceae bacterium]